MKEKIKNFWEDNIYKTLENSIIFHLPTIEFLIKQRNWDALNLFVFYCYCSKLQRNSKRVWCSDDFVAKNLKWRKQRVLNAKKELKEYKIINVVPYKEKSEKSGGMIIKKWFVEIIPLLNNDNIIKTSEVPNLRGSQYSHLSNGNHSSIEINNNNSIEINYSVREDLKSSTTSSFKEENKENKNKETSQFQETANSEKEKNSSAVRDVFSYFYKKCKDEMGFYPVINYAKEGKLIKTKLPLLEKNHTTYQKLIDFYFESPEVEKLGPALSTIFSSFFVNKFLKEFGFTDEEYKKRQELKEKFKRSNK